jgi:hypothetical protein
MCQPRAVHALRFCGRLRACTRQPHGGRRRRRAQAGAANHRTARTCTARGCHMGTRLLRPHSPCAEVGTWENICACPRKSAQCGRVHVNNGGALPRPLVQASASGHTGRQAGRGRSPSGGSHMRAWRGARRAPRPPLSARRAAWSGRGIRTARACDMALLRVRTEQAGKGARLRWLPASALNKGIFERVTPVCHTAAAGHGEAGSLRTGQRKRKPPPRVLAASNTGHTRGARGAAGRAASRAPASWPGAPPRGAPPPRTPGP